MEPTLAGGFDIPVPGRLANDIELPARVERSLEVHGREVLVGARPQSLRMTPAMLWYGVASSV